MNFKDYWNPNYMLMGILAGLILAFGWFIFHSSQLEVIQKATLFDSIDNNFNIFNCTVLNIQKFQDNSYKIACSRSQSPLLNNSFINIDSVEK